ncbi:MAG: sialidase family protein, partial [Promethearchaeota archaeon]
MIKRKRNVLIFFILINLILNTSNYFENNILESRRDNHKKDSSINNFDIKTNQFNWFIPPTLSRKYFSPDASPGQGDTVLYYFAVDTTEDYILNISAYYDPIDNFPGLLIDDYVKSAAYLMSNGTWLIAAIIYNLTIQENQLLFGYGVNATDIKWKSISIINETQHLAIAGDESGKIRIVYYEQSGVYRLFKGVICFSSNDWGKTWSNITFIDYTNNSLLKFYGLSIAAFKGNFTCVWSATLDNFEENASIIITQEINNSWSTPENLTIITDIGPLYPQVFYNHTKDNGTLFLTYEPFFNWTKGMFERNSTIVELKNGIHAAPTGKWGFIPKLAKTSTSFKYAYWALDYNTSKFYILDYTAAENNLGIKTATWGQNIADLPVDTFKPEIVYRFFNIYGINGPKCFSGSVLNPDKKRTLGILDCKAPFSVRFYNGTANAYDTVSYIFDGKDEAGNSREAMAYCFNLKVGTTLDGEYQSIVYVDNSPFEINYSINTNRISPFSSPGINDKLTINVKGNKDADVKLNILSPNPINKSTYISRDLGDLSFFKLCGDGIQTYAFFTNFDDPIYQLMFMKSTDGGNTWSDPTIIDNLFADKFVLKRAAISGDNVYLWTSSSYNSIDPVLYTSSDGGEIFVKHSIPLPVHAVTSDLVCWYGYAAGTNEYIINKSIDLGYTWTKFCNLTINSAQNYTLECAAYDPVSRNYSFILSHQEEKIVRFISITNNGSESTLSENLIQNPKIFSEFNLLDLTTLGVIVNSSKSKWIIVSPAVNDDINNLLGYLAYCTSEDGITFSDWKNFTAITGNNLKVYYYMRAWDIIFPENGYPCLMSGVKGVGGPARDINITSKSNFVFGKSSKLDENYECEFTFSGITSDGDILPDG